MKTLHIGIGYEINTPTGHQEVISQYGGTCYIVHNYDENDQYTGASYLTDREIIRAHHDLTGRVYEMVEFDG